MTIYRDDFITQIDPGWTNVWGPGSWAWSSSYGGSARAVATTNNNLYKWTAAGTLSDSWSEVVWVGGDWVAAATRIDSETEFYFLIVNATTCNLYVTTQAGGWTLLKDNGTLPSLSTRVGRIVSEGLAHRVYTGPEGGPLELLSVSVHGILQAIQTGGIGMFSYGSAAAYNGYWTGGNDITDAELPTQYNVYWSTLGGNGGLSVDDPLFAATKIGAVSSPYEHTIVPAGEGMLYYYVTTKYDPNTYAESLASNELSILSAGSSSSAGQIIW